MSSVFLKSFFCGFVVCVCIQYVCVCGFAGTPLKMAIDFGAHVSIGLTFKRFFSSMSLERGCWLTLNWSV